MNKQALIKLAQIRLAINYVLRNRMQKRAGGLNQLGYNAAKFYGGAGLAFGKQGLEQAENSYPEAMRTVYNGINNMRNRVAPYFYPNKATKPSEDFDKYLGTDYKPLETDWKRISNIINDHPMPKGLNSIGRGKLNSPLSSGKDPGVYDAEGSQEIKDILSGEL